LCIEMIHSSAPFHRWCPERRVSVWRSMSPECIGLRSGAVPQETSFASRGWVLQLKQDRFR
jgi:hypothetical protein